MLSDDKVILRPITIEDVNDEYLSWLNNPDISFGLAKRKYSLVDLKNYVQQKINDDNCKFFAIIDRHSNLHIGNIKLDNYDPECKIMDLGILIGDKNFWGKSYGRSACTLMIDYGFNVLGLRKIWLAVYENNPAAKKLYENLGFKLEGKLRKHICINGTYFDKYLMGLFKEEWNQKK
ncbi:MAG: GNAT family protein [Bacteroidia bacterium]